MSDGSSPRVGDGLVVQEGSCWAAEKEKERPWADGKLALVRMLMVVA